jgi:hypothetical protein
MGIVMSRIVKVTPFPTEFDQYNLRRLIAFVGEAYVRAQARSERSAVEFTLLIAYRVSRRAIV